MISKKRLLPTNPPLLIAIGLALNVGLATCHTEVAHTTGEEASDHNYCNLDNLPSNCHDHQITRTQQPTQKCFIAAVYEHARLTGATIQEMQEKNLNVFDQVAQIAAEKGAKIIVFPEDGITYGSKSFVYNGLTEIPDPQTLSGEDKIPCLNSTSENDSEILKRLSCIARKHKIYLVANFGTKQVCTPGHKVSASQQCPDKGFLALNTDVVFDDQGNFVARYRKHNLYIEIFDETPSLEVVHFDTPFGRFGVFTCFDMMFKSPAIDLVEEHHIDTAVFPTWWFDELPILSAIQFQDGWSRMNKVNLLASNIHKLEVGSVGSGIYGDRSTIYVGAGDKGSNLILSTLPTKFGDTVCDNYREVVPIGPTDEGEPNYRYSNYKLLANDSVHKLSDPKQGSETFCNGQFCCDISYKIVSYLTKYAMDRLILIIRDNSRAGEFNWFEQVCQLVTLKEPFDPIKSSSIEYSTSPVAEFEHLSIEAKFSSKYVYPITARGNVKLLNRRETSYGCAKTDHPERSHNCGVSFQGYPTPIYSFGLYARVYDCDVVSMAK